MQEFDPGPILEGTPSDDYGVSDLMEVDSLKEDQRPAQADRLLVSVDFGTTFSCVAYMRLLKEERPEDVHVSWLRCINRFKDYKPKGEMARVREDVPTELWYNTEPETHPPRSYSPMASRLRKKSVRKSAYPDSDEEESERPRELRARQRMAEDQSQVSRPRCWGFGVQNQLKRIDLTKHESTRVSRFKLLLDNSGSTETIREALHDTIGTLKQENYIQDKNDIYTHYLTHLLQNAREQLEQEQELRDNPSIEFILCVPAKWPIRGTRILQTAMERAVKDAGFGSQAQDSVSNLFLVTEPEAAAACVLAENQNEIYFNEVVLVLDAGGGTVDAVTYGVTCEEPLRFDDEVCPPESELCGASFINERFSLLLEEKLHNETTIVRPGKSLQSIIESLTIAFENGEKRSFNTEDEQSEMDPIEINDLKANPNKNFIQNHLLLDRYDTNHIFGESLRGTNHLLNKQLELAAGKGRTVQKVILTGGFGQSPSLQSYLKRKVKKYNQKNGTDIQLLIPISPSTAVAKGAILRALNKSEGPSRKIHCSYGFLRDELHDHKKYPEHMRAVTKIDEADGQRYVIDTIDWLINVGDQVANREEIPITVKHTFPLESTELICIEELYVSEKRHKSHYRKENLNNKGAELAGSIIADMSFLLHEGRIQPESPSEFNISEAPGKLHYAVRFELVMIVEGRNLRYQARWPIAEDLQPGQMPIVKAQAQICIAAAFEPGTA